MEVIEERSNNANYKAINKEDDNGPFVKNLLLEDIRESIKGRSDFRECHYEDHNIFIYHLGMGLFYISF